MKLALTIRSISVATALMVAGFSAQALTLNFAGTKSNSVLNFSEAARQLFEAQGGYIEAKGNATALDTGDFNYVFNMPVTKIVINGSLKIASGSAVGSALDIVRETRTVTYKINLANFTLDYINHQVLADLTPLGGTTTVQAKIYDFNVATPLALKYKFPLTITGHEVLDTLKLTPSTTDAFMSALNLGASIRDTVAAADFGTLTQDISTNARKPAASTTPYKP